MSSYIRNNIKARRNLLRILELKKKMMKQKSEQSIQKIKVNVQEGYYSLKRVPAEERNPFRVKRIKELWKKIKQVKEESTEDKMLLFFELGKELGDKRTLGD